MSNETVNEEKLSLYYEWAKKVCAIKNIRIGKELMHIKDEKLYCISTDIGDLYLKKTTSFIIDELKFTLRLMDSGIVNLPEWVGYDHDMKVCLMRDMGGSNLSDLSSLGMETIVDMFISLSRIQKASIQYVNSDDFYGCDYKINTMLNELKNMPEFAYEMLSETPYKISRDEKSKLSRNAEHVTAVLKSINDSRLPDTIHHGDLGAYNVRIIEGRPIFYDWGCGGVSHPFFDTFRLLSASALREKLPADIPAENIIVDAYLREWSEYGNHDELKSMFMAIYGLSGFYMAYVKYIRTKNLHLSYAENPEAISADGVGLDRRYESAAIYLKRFISDDF